MGIADDIALRIDEIGETLTWYSFSAYNSESYVDSNWNAPDPDHADYPTSGSIPGASYGDGTSMTGIVQPLTRQDGPERLVETPWGEQVEAKLRVYLKGTETVTVRDKVTWNGSDYWVAGWEDWRVGGAVLKKVYLVDKVA